MQTYCYVQVYDKVKTLVSREWIWETLYKTDKVACKYNYEYTDSTSQIGNTWSKLYRCFFLCTMALKYLTTVLTEMYWTESEQW